MKGGLPQQSWLTKQVHISWHIAVASLGILIGVAGAPVFAQQFTSVSWLIIAASLMLTVSIRRARYLLIVALLAGLTVGLWRGSGEFSALQEIRPFIGKTVIVKGTVTEDTTYGSKGDQRFRIGAVVINQQRLAGVIWVSANGKNDIKRGDVVEVKGKLGEGFGNIPASMFKVTVLRIERPVPGDIGRQVRDWFGGGVANAMPPGDAEFAMAYLLGQRLTLSETLNDQLRTVGLIHAVVASGYHLTVLMSVVRRLFVRVSKYLTALFSAGMIGGFIMITGFSPSMTRAGLVSSLSLLAWYYGRVIHPLVLLPFAAALTVLYQPAYVWGDVGWYLSFAAFSGVLVLAPLLHDYFWGKTKQPSILREVLVATLAAQVVTLPITIYVFGYYSMYALLANLLVVPLIPLTMLLTFVGGVMGLIAPAIAPAFGKPVVWLLHYMTTVVGWIAGLPAAKTEVTFSIVAVALSYIFISIVILWLWRVTGHNYRRDLAIQKEF